jgi:hypothetical protein
MARRKAAASGYYQADHSPMPEKMIEQHCFLTNEGTTDIFSTELSARIG